MARAGRVKRAPVDGRRHRGDERGDCRAGAAARPGPVPHRAVRAAGGARRAADALRLQSRTGARAGGGAEPLLALIRLQWWREVVEGARGGTRSPSRWPRRWRRGGWSRRPAGADRRARGGGGAGDRDVAGVAGLLLGSAGGLAVAAGRLLGARSRSPRRSEPLTGRRGCCVAWRRTPGRAAACCLRMCWPSMG